MGETLVAEVDGELVAALPVDRGAAVDGEPRPWTGERPWTAGLP